MTREIPLTKGKVAIVDDEDFHTLNQWKWYASNESRGTKWYAIRRVKFGNKRLKIRMHRFIMGVTVFERGAVVDHINHDSLDNRRSNLEIVTQKENMHRSAGWKGSRTFREKQEATQ